MIFRSPLRAFTLVELLVVIAIIGIMVAALLPAIQNSRETARQVQCSSHLTRIAAAMQEYTSANESFPSGTTNETGPIRNVEDGLHHSWVIPLLAFLDEPAAASRIDPNVSVYDPKHLQVRELPLTSMNCPSASNFAGQYPGTNYAGVHHDQEKPIDETNMGMLFLNSHVTANDITDGAHYTLLVGEKLVPADDLGWMSGTRATLRNTGTMINATMAVAGDPLFVGGFASAHPNGAQFIFSDGSLRFIADQVDEQVYHQMANRADGELINLQDL